MDSWCYFSEKSVFSSSGSDRKISDEKAVYNPPTAFSPNYESGPKRSDSSMIIDLKLGRTSERSVDSLNRKKTPFCQVYGCKKDLSSSKEYHKRHKVCDIHSKTAKVIVNGIEQRFCQQCSRFHILSEFDNGKRSCRKRLAGHNERRRKPRLGISNFKDYYGSRFQDTNTSTLSVSWENRLHSSKLVLQQENEPVYYSPQRSNHAAILNNSLTRTKIDEINEFPNQDGVIMFSDIGSTSSNFQQPNSSCVLSLLSSLSQDSPKNSHSSWMNNNIASLHYGDHNPVNIQGTDCMVTAISCHIAGGDPNTSFLR